MMRRIMQEDCFVSAGELAGFPRMEAGLGLSVRRGRLSYGWQTVP